MKKKISFGKIAYETKIKVNLVELNIELKKTNNEFIIDYETLQLIPPDSLCLSISGIIWDAKKNEINAGGQCLDEISKYLKNDNFNIIYNIWKEYHLNDMQAGTKKQKEAIKEWLKSGNEYNYDNVCKYLKSINLYYDMGYKYGSYWLFKQIPENILKYIESLN